MTRPRGNGEDQGGDRTDGLESTLPESPPGAEGGSVRVNTAATAANTATPPRRPPARRAPARAARPPAGPRPSPWRPMGQRGPRKEDAAGPKVGAPGAHRARGELGTRRPRQLPGRAGRGVGVGPARTFLRRRGGRKCGVSQG